MIFSLLLAFAAGEAQPLTVAEAIARALERNPEMVAERTGKEGAAAALQAAKGAFDPVLGFRFAQRTATTPATSILQGINGRLDERTSGQATTLRQRLPWMGMRLENQIENNRVSTSTPFPSLNPYSAPVWRTTLAVPVFYSLFDDLTVWVGRVRSRA